MNMLLAARAIFKNCDVEVVFSTSTTWLNGKHEAACRTNTAFKVQTFQIHSSPHLAWSIADGTRRQIVQISADSNIEELSTARCFQVAMQGPLLCAGVAGALLTIRWGPRLQEFYRILVAAYVRISWAVKLRMTDPPPFVCRTRRLPRPRPVSVCACQESWMLGLFLF